MIAYDPTVSLAAIDIPEWAMIAYLVAAVLFILGIKGLTHPRTAVRGNLMSAVGMLIAVVVTVPAISGATGWIVVLAGVIVGGGIGAVAATRVQMTAMPQMVAIFNGFGGGASIFVAWAELASLTKLVYKQIPEAFTPTGGINLDSSYTLEEIGAIKQQAIDTGYLNILADGSLQFTPPSIAVFIAIALAGLIGAVTFSGSFIAFGKLQEFKIFWNPWVLPLHQPLNAALFVAALVFCTLIIMGTGASFWWFLPLVIVALIMGVTLTCPIGGADMPVVIALLNSYSGLAAAATGFVINNTVLIIAGSLVGASGIILTVIMCKAMNRSLFNVIFGKIDASKSTSSDDIYDGKIKATSADEIAMMLDGAQNVVIVPGYGMAVAQAQHAVRDLFNELEARDVNVEFAVHPVAGRMPGHMNVLLAEVDIPYEKLVESDNINPHLDTVDMAIVLGANDVVNPDARKPDSAIAGMPIVDVDKCRTVVVIKRSLSPGFAGIPNPLFALDNALMFFGDGRKTIEDLVAAVKEN